MEEVESRKEYIIFLKRILSLPPSWITVFLNCCDNNVVIYVSRMQKEEGDSILCVCVPWIGREEGKEDDPNIMKMCLLSGIREYAMEKNEGRPLKIPHPRAVEGKEER